MRKLHAKDGSPLTPKVFVKFFAPGNKKCQSIVLRASHGRGFHAEGIDAVLERYVQMIEQRFPAEEYRLVSLGSNRFNFVHVGPKAAQEQA